jgi:hypothetical protein
VTQFREFVWQKNHLAVWRDVGEFKVLFSSKDMVSFNSRGISNAKDMATYVQAHLPFFGGRKVMVRAMNLAKLDMKSQLERIGAVDVWVTPSGATSFSSPFLRPDASVIVVPFCGRGETVNVFDSLCVGGFCCYVFENYLFDALRSNVEIYPVHMPEDVVGKCECQGMTCTDCNVRMRGDKILELVRRSLFFTLTYRETRSAK